MDQEEFDEKCRLHKLYREHQPGGIRGDFRGADLREIDFTKAVVQGATFESAILKGNRLLNADFDRCDMTNSDLTGCVVNNANLAYCDFRGARLDGVNIDRAYSLQACIGNGRELKTFQINEHFSVVYTATTIWIGCWDNTIAKWQQLDLKDPNVVDGLKKWFYEAGGKDGLEFAKIYAEDHPHIILYIATEVDPAV